ncbi:hypothetical protein OH76DRAFT_914194 [Lentinus brumalis]|uniref:Uncharacterized protein n=1 Tax=Lentinus brumalis TaxID=2498619 RepID=A0A371D044_9APHY|nr:hypothetical protein OH76DRAFT_914194 [Polyporus brumalis]
MAPAAPNQSCGQEFFHSSRTCGPCSAQLACDGAAPASGRFFRCGCVSLPRACRFAPLCPSLFVSAPTPPRLCAVPGLPLTVTVRNTPPLSFVVPSRCGGRSVAVCLWRTVSGGSGCVLCGTANLCMLRVRVRTGSISREGSGSLGRLWRLGYRGGLPLHFRGCVCCVVVARQRVEVGERAALLDVGGGCSLTSR